MNISFFLRNTSFWFLDFCKGRKIRKHYNEIKNVYENFNSKGAKNIRETHLNNLLSHAVNTTPYYVGYLNYSNLEDFPVINKLIIRDRFDEFRSDTYRDKKNVKVSSSGSTGTPFKIYQNVDKQHRNIADTIFFAELSGFKIGQKLYFMRVWTDSNRKSKLLAWLQNMEMEDTKQLNDSSIKNFIKRLGDDKEEKGILSYASTLEAVCKYLEKSKVQPKDYQLTSVIANSESLSEYTKETFQKYFKSAVVSRYSNAECGILSQQHPKKDNSFEINWGSYYVEILKDNEDTPAKIGDLGRVAITDLFNYCMPIIRYDTGDIAKLGYNDEGMLVFKLVEGRKQDLVYNTQGDLVSSFVIGGLMKKYTDVLQYQFVQESKSEYLLKLNVAGQFGEKASIAAEFKEVFGSDCVIKLVFLDDIPVLPSGKRRQVVNNYNVN